MLERKDIDNLANLARIALSESEKDKLQKDMESILSYISELQKAPSVGEDHQPENYYLRNVMREDVEPFESGLNTETILSQAPKRRENFFVVKKILGDSLS